MTTIELAEPDREVFRKHHPGLLQSDDQIVRQFVVRQRELDILLEVLRRNLEAPSCQHALILGPRGRGKSTMLARVGAALRQEPDLASGLVPVWFADDSAEIFDIASLWLDALFHLAREIETDQPGIARELRETRSDLTRRGWSPALEEHARSALLEAAERMDRRLVLMVENLHALSDAMNDDFGWKLRATLQSEPRIILVATATTHFKGLDDAQAPFFELFRTLTLEPLNTEECGRLWTRITGESVGGRDMRPLGILTGGSPRLLVVVGEFAAQSSEQGLMERLATLVDGHSEYFRSQLDALPALERRVFLALADLWRPSEPREIAARAMMDIRRVSVMLGRLKSRGAILKQSEGRKQLYSVAERLLNIYYKMRREQSDAPVVSDLVRYMVVFYSATDRPDWFSRLLAEARTVPSVREGLARTLAEHPDLEIFWSEENLPMLGEVHRRAAEILTEKASETMSGVVASWEALEKEHVLELVHAAFPEGDPGPELSDFQKVFTLALYVILVRKSRGQDSVVDTLRSTVRSFTDSKSDAVREHLILALSEIAHREFLKGDLTACIETCTQTVVRFGQCSGKDMPKPLAWVWNILGDAYRTKHDNTNARQAYDTVLERFEHRAEPELQRQRLRALLAKAMLHQDADDSQTTLARLDREIAWFEESPDEGTAALHALALFSRALEQQTLERLDEALETVKDVVCRLENDESPPGVLLHAVAMVQMGTLQTLLLDTVSAVQTYDEAIARHQGEEVSMLAPVVARHLSEQAFADAEKGNITASQEKCEQVLERFGAIESPEVQSCVVMALVCYVTLEVKIGSPDRALSLCDALEARVDQVSVAGRPGLLWLAHSSRASAFMEKGVADASVAAFGAAYEVFLPADDMMMRSIQTLVPGLIAAGASPQELVRVLTDNPDKAETVSPLVAGLRLYAGETVRVPAEVLEVAKDVVATIRERVANESD